MSRLRLAARAVELARRHGADHAVAGASRSRAFEMRCRDGAVETVEESRSTSVRLELLVDGRYSTHATTDLRDGPLDAFVGEAVALTRLLEVDPHRRPTPEALWRDRREIDLDLVDPRVDAISNEDRIAACRSIEEGARSGADVLGVTTWASDGRVTTARVSSDGFSGTRTCTSASLGTQVGVADEGGKRPEGYRFCSATHLADLMDAGEVGRVALARTLAKLGARKSASARATLVLAPEAGGGFLRRPLGALHASAIQQRSSFLADRMGEPVSSPLLRIVDEPHRPRSLASRLYDGDGMTTRERTIVDDGVLRSFYVDVYYGSKLGLEPTTTGSTNTVFQGGEGDLESLTREVADGFLVRGWLGGNANATTGDFSFGFHGHRITGGRIDAPVAEMNVTGNYREVLPRLVAVGADPDPWSTFRTPTLVFEGVDFSGA
ncbi:MAG: TldD/PmbA family protein [Planctomycetota bacterium]